MFRTISALILSIATTGTMANGIKELDTYRMEYRASYNGMPIDAVRELTRTDQGYRVQTVASNFFGKITETETFTSTADGRLQPLSYSYNRSVFGVKRKESLNVDRARGVAIFQRKDKSGEIPLNGGSYLGPVSYQEQIRQDLLQNRDQLSYPVIIRGSIQQYDFEVVGEEMLKTPEGNFNTVRLSRIRDDDSTRETYLWLAPALNYRLVKLLQKEEDGETYELNLVSAQPGKAPVVEAIAHPDPISDSCDNCPAEESGRIQ